MCLCRTKVSHPPEGGEGVEGHTRVAGGGGEEEEQGAERKEGRGRVRKFRREEQIERHGTSYVKEEGGPPGEP